MLRADRCGNHVAHIAGHLIYRLQFVVHHVEVLQVRLQQLGTEAHVSIGQGGVALRQVGQAISQEIPQEAHNGAICEITPAVF